MKKIGITMGDPSGVGPEIVLKSYAKHGNIFDSIQPVVFGHAEILKNTARILGISVQVEQISDPKQIPEHRSGHIYCYAESDLKEVPVIGKTNPYSGELAFEYIRISIDLANKGIIDAVATAPINKDALKMAKVPYLDHTAMYTSLTNSSNTMTLFMTGSLRVFFLTRHISLKEVAAAINIEQTVSALSFCQNYLHQLGLSNPSVALAALNPHASDQGLFGTEERDVLIPAVEQARTSGINAIGPVPADSVFHLAKEGNYDAVLSLYHDQGHIAAKTLDFYGTVSLTMGLPFLRTSVDHGTANEIAGKNQANEKSMVEAIKSAAQFAW